uniref:CBM1 domain-containing protein n=1 Tax=Pyrodinium bahamense TaxID=73915 RepID=A0A7S0A954_9DINO
MTARGRSAMMRESGWRLATGAALFAASALLAASAMWQGREPGHAEVSSEFLKHEIQAYAHPFKQCGGKDWTGPTCCAPGCACVRQTSFYSQCQPPKGGTQCRLEDVMSEHETAQEEVEKWTPIAETKAKDAARAASKLERAKAALEEAKATKERVEQEGAELLKAKKSAEEWEVKTKSAAEKASAEAAKVGSANMTTAADVAALEKTSALISSGVCAGMYGQCGGSNFDASRACCQAGCNCVWKDNFYSQCESASGNCNAGEAAVQAKALRAKAKRLRSEAARTARAKRETAAAAVQAHTKADVARRRAAPVVTAVQRAEKVLQAKQDEERAAAKQDQDARNVAEKAALKKRNAIAAVKGWGKAAQTKCGKEANDGTTGESADKEESLDAREDKLDDEEDLGRPSAHENEMRFLLRKMIKG